MAYFADDISLKEIKDDTDLAEEEYKDAIYEYTETLKDIYTEKEIKDIIDNIIIKGLYLYNYTEDEIIDYKDEIIAKELNLKFQKALYTYKEFKEIYDSYIIDQNNIFEEQITNAKYNMESSKKIVDTLWEKIKQFSNLNDK